MDWPFKGKGNCACVFEREDDFGEAKLIEPCARHARMQEEIERLRADLAAAREEIEVEARQYEDLREAYVKDTSAANAEIKMLKEELQNKLDVMDRVTTQNGGYVFSLRAELAVCKAMCERQGEQLAAHKLLAEQQKEQLAASQLVIQQMREALEHVLADCDFESDDAQISFREGVNAIALQPTTEALEAYVAQAVEKEREECAKECEEGWCGRGDDFANAIRARKDKQ